MSKYQKLQELFQSTQLPDLSLEKKYQSHLQEQIKQYTDFVNTAKPHIHDDLTIQDEIVGTHETNKKIPFNIERGDTIGVSLANNYTDSQITQSEEYIKLMKARSEELTRQINQKQETSDKLDVFIDDLEKRLENETGEEQDEIGLLRDQLYDEKTRYRELRKQLKSLFAEYE